MVPIKVVYEYLGNSVITGIQAGDKVVVEGKQNLRPGGKTREAKSNTKAEAKTEKNAPATANPTTAKSTTDKK